VIPATELRHLPADSPLPAPLAKLSPPLGSPAPPCAKAPPRCPRTGPPVANRRRAHRRPGFFPHGQSVRPRRQPVAPFPPPPPPLSLAYGPHGDAVAPARPRRLLALGRSWAGALARALRLAGPKIPPAHLQGNPFSFSFFQPFLI
jgi:hypothetical protein